MRGMGLWLALVLAGCEHGDCATGTTRCGEGRVEVCDGDGRWSAIADCREVSAQQQAPWACCAVPRAEDGGTPVHACLPQQECEGAK
jgi:hypothetical protein